MLSLVLVLWFGIAGTMHYFRGRGDRLDLRQRIAATLVSWGRTPESGQTLVAEEDIRRHVALLYSPDGEERVRAAWWLGERGVRQAGPAIVASMADTGTLRPCQLAHNLGKLGDDRWVDDLVRASHHPTNVDLRVCAAYALGDLASSRAIDGLIDGYRRNLASIATLESLGKIAEPSTLGFLRSVAEHPRNEWERQAAQRAITQTELMAQNDPVPALLYRVVQSAHGRSLDYWAVRKLAERGDSRAVPVLRDILSSNSRSEEDRVIAAAALLMCGEPGISALRAIASDGPAAVIAGVALRLGNHTAVIQEQSNNAPVASNPWVSEASE